MVNFASKNNIPSKVPISFPIPLAEALDATHVHYVESEGNGTTCPGNAAEPTATPGNLCIYQNFVTGKRAQLLHRLGIEPDPAAPEH
jgi:hypothetical protein